MNRYALAALLACACACSDVHKNLVSDPVSARPVSDAASGRVADAADAAESMPHDAALQSVPDASHVAVRCGKHACACDDGLDNDQDGLTDGLDPECTGAFDDDETSFATGQPNKQGACRDCFWDDNAGSGDDGCRYPAECLTGAAPPNGNGNCGSCEVSAQCVASCQARTPNGCDCFGCCEVVRSSGDHVFIQLAESCQLDRLDDLASCPRCVQNSACANPCGRCELCLGKSAASLPSDCAHGGSGPGFACEDGLAVCSAALPCALYEYCQLGCCLVDLQ